LLTITTLFTGAALLVEMTSPFRVVAAGSLTAEVREVSGVLEGLLEGMLDGWAEGRAEGSREISPEGEAEGDTV